MDRQHRLDWVESPEWVKSIRRATMTYYGPKELAASFRTVRNNTITVAQDIPAEKYGFQTAPGARTVAQMLVHLAVSPRLGLQLHRVERRSSLEGFDFGTFVGGLAA